MIWRNPDIIYVIMRPQGLRPPCTGRVFLWVALRSALSGNQQAPAHRLSVTFFLKTLTWGHIHFRCFFVSYKEIMQRLDFCFGKAVENITLCSHNSIKCIFYHLNVAQTIKGRLRLEICLMRKAEATFSDNTDRDKQSEKQSQPEQLTREGRAWAPCTHPARRFPGPRGLGSLLG